jgi:hypothetical protein
MDERRTGEYGYRRPLLQARNENPQVPGRPIEPFGYTEAEARVLLNGTRAAGAAQHREALGSCVRRFTNTGAKQPATGGIPPARGTHSALRTQARR